ncbi:MAG: hypothetical protein C3F06_00365 [Candidatus Methanoperedenaceae archaeon]|nr:MAG: hypothetical protein C3F06_00365 [Candidatus Methanoperedenaceae archaeon]
MSIINFILQLATIILALAGAYFAANTSYLMIRKTDLKVIRAKAFLHHSFIRDNWMLLFIGCFLFLVNAIIHFDELLGLFIVEDNSHLLQDILLLGILTCSVIAQYKWFRLLTLSTAKAGRFLFR